MALSRIGLRHVNGTLTGCCHLNGHLAKIDIIISDLCRLCNEEVELEQGKTSSANMNSLGEKILSFMNLSGLPDRIRNNNRCVIKLRNLFIVYVLTHYCIIVH